MTTPRRRCALPAGEDWGVALARDLNKDGLAAVEGCPRGLEGRAAYRRRAFPHMAGHVDAIRTHRNDLGEPIFQCVHGGEKIVGPPRFDEQLGFRGAGVAGEDKAATFLRGARAQHFPGVNIGFEVVD